MIFQVEAPAADREAALKKTMQIIERRLHLAGVSSFTVEPEGAASSDQIRVSLAGSGNGERLKRIVTASGRLELAHVISAASPAPIQTYATKEEAIDSLHSNGAIPANRRILPYTRSADREDSPGAARDPWLVIESPAVVDGGELKDASAVPNRDGQSYEIVFSLTKDGAGKFGVWTGANVNEYIAVVLNETVRSTAYIRSQIFDQGEINGRFTKSSAEDLALVLRSGSLPFPVKFVSERFTQIK